MSKLAYSIGGATLGLLLLLGIGGNGNDWYYGNQNQLLQVAMAEYEENADVSGGAKYWEYWGKTEEQWCVDFVYYCADQIGLVGEDCPLGTYTGGVGECWRNAKAQGCKQFAVGEDTPQPGDLVYWYSASRAASSVDVIPPMLHIGIVMSYSEDGLITIEGNSGGGGSANSHIRQNYYPDIYGASWKGAAIFGFTRITDSSNLLDFVKHFEGFSKYPTWDYAQYSVGYGTRCPDDRFAEYTRYGISEASAEALLREEIDAAARSVDAYAAQNALTLLPHQRDALISLTYNIGSGWMSSASYANFRAALQDPTTEELAVVQAFANICHAGGQVLPSLVERRLCEAQLYLSGSYSTTPTDYTYSVIGDTVTVRRRR